MSKTKKYLQGKALERLPGPAVGALGSAVVRGVDLAVENRWDRALEAAANAQGETPEQRAKSVVSSFRRELTTIGAASGAVAAAPGIGTAAAGAALVADLGWFAVRSTDLIMTIGAVYGHVESTAEERRTWVLSILAFGEQAAEQFTGLLGGVEPAVRVGGEQARTKIASLIGSDAITLDAMRRINATLAAQVVKKYGARRSALTVGKLLPFGVGAVVGGAANFGFVRVAGKQAIRFFEAGPLLPRSGAWETSEPNVPPIGR